MVKRAKGQAQRQGAMGSQGSGESRSVWANFNPIPLKRRQVLELRGNLEDDCYAIIRSLSGCENSAEFYMRTALQETVKNPTLLKSCFGSLCSVVADKCGTSQASVRTSLCRWHKIAWANRNGSNMALWRIVIGGCEEDAPGVKTFLTKMTDQLRSQYLDMQR